MRDRTTSVRRQLPRNRVRLPAAGPGYSFKSERVSGVSVDGLVIINPKGIFAVASFLPTTFGFRY